MSEIYDLALAAVKGAELTFCRYITANDTGETGSHQCGFYVPKFASKILFAEPGIKGENKEKQVVIKWQGSFETQSRFIYYGRGTRNEYRITRFGKDFPFLTDDNIGNLLVLAKSTDEYYQAFVLSQDEDIESFFAYFDYSPENPHLIIPEGKSPTDSFEETLMSVVTRFDDFPTTEIMAKEAQRALFSFLKISQDSISAIPDEIILKLIKAEFSLFRLLENKIYSNVISVPFTDCQALIDFSNTILNRRKSRAGKSLEHHLASIFDSAKLKYEQQVITEDNKKPDFIFPGSEEYHDFTFPADKLVFLGAKTTCKDRWRQILNEADRIDEKFLFTLQQGITSNQLREMKHEHVTLVVPQAYRSCFAKEYRQDILSLRTFINFVQSKQS